jgi:signal transduction histidine kinase/CheY-like chemotaxis protein/HPt (histidine-containing phosphotransfer) domain-containing protein
MQLGPVRITSSVTIVVTGSLSLVLLVKESYITVREFVATATPALLLTTALAETAAAILLSVMFAKTRSRALLSLCATEQVCAIIHTTLFLHLPYSTTPAVTAAPFPGAWPSGTSLYVFAIGAIWYAVEQRRSITVAALTADRLIGIWLPTTAIGTVFLMIAVPAAVEPPISATIACLGATAAIVYGVLRRVPPNRLSQAVLVGLGAALADSVLSAVRPLPDLVWLVSKTLGLVIPVAIGTAVVQFLIDQLSDDLLQQANAIRNEADAAGKNAIVEAAIVKSQFVAAVSHELRTPLGGILGMAELLERTTLGDEQRTFVGAIQSSATSLLRIVNDLLDFSRSESGRLELEDLPFSLVELVDDVATLFMAETAARNVGLYVFVDPALPKTVFGDAVRVKQVLQNLLNNAVRFTPAGHIRVDVKRSPDAPAMILFTVADTGVGIAAGALARIFEPFTQEDASTTRRFGGTGLGLSIARHLVELMGGQIGVQSTRGVGSTFTFTLPLRANALGGETLPLRDLHVLVIESDATVRTLLQTYMEAWAMRTFVCASTADAQAIVDATLRTESRDLIVVGPSISRTEAAEFARRNRSRVSLANSSWISISGDAVTGQLPPGFDAVVPGPLRQSKLYDAIVNLRQRDVVERTAHGAVAQREPRPERILVAEDSEVNALLMDAQLEHLGFRADTVGDGELAVEAALSGNYDLIFMDCQMPGTDGFEATRRIRAQAAGDTQVPIIAVTASVLPGYRDICLDAGMSDYLAKPALIGPLASILDRWLPAEAAREEPVVVDCPPFDDTQIRLRLREIFDGDESRVEATIQLALRSLREGTDMLAALDVRDASDEAARIAHKLKGVALDIGFVRVAERARAVEAAIRAADWTAFEAGLPALVRAIARVAAAESGVAE